MVLISGRERHSYRRQLATGPVRGFIARGSSREFSPGSFPDAAGLGAADVVALLAAVGAERVAGPEMPDAAGDLLAGLALLVGGAAAWAKRPGSRSGPLSVLAGVAWFAGLTDVLLYAHRAARYLLLTYPSGRVDSRAAAVVISAAYVDGLVPELPLGVVARRAYGGGLDGRRGDTEQSAVWSVAPARRRWPVP